MDRMPDLTAGPAGTKSVRSGRRLLNAERAYAEIKRRILDNEMPAGHQVLEQDLAEMLEMSRTPVREAMIRLAEEGMVEIRPRHGLRVLPLSAADMQEIYQVLTALESTAAQLAAERGLDDEHLAQLRKAVADMERALAADDLHAWAAADARFHMLLVDSCGNARLKSLVRTFWDQSHRARLTTLRLRPRPLDSNRDHAALVDAITRRDAEAARVIHRQHRIRVGRMLISLLKEHGLTQL